MSLIKKARVSLLVIVLSLVSLYVFFQALPINSAIHNQIVDNFIELEKNQMEIKQILLKIRLNQNLNFDRLMYLEKRQLALAEYNKVNIPYILGGDSELIYSYLEEYSQSQTYISELIGNFIRSSAILKNSISYFIFLGKDFSNFLSNNIDSSNESDIVKNIIADTLILDFSIKTAMDISNERNKIILSDILNQFEISSDYNYSFLPNHLDKITTHSQLMENDMQSILSIDVEDSINTSFTFYLQQHSVLEKKNNLFSNFASLIITLLITYIAFYVFSLKKTKGDLLNEVNKLSSAMEQSHDAVMISDPKLKIEYVNPTFTEITGYHNEEINGRSPKFLGTDDNPDEFYDSLWETINSGKTWTGEMHKKRKNGELYWASESVSAIFDSDRKLSHFLSTHRDVTEQHDLNEQITFHASHDALTGLVNRREFEQRAEHLLLSSSNNEEAHALCFMDLDQFKVVNDTCGHAAGDELLRQLGLNLKKAMRKRDLLARLGGDEFGVLIEHCSLEDAHTVARLLQEVIQNYQFSWSGRNFKVGVSIGLIAITDKVSNLSELLKNADASCYIAKQTGRNRIHTYTDNDTEIAKHQGQMLWVTRIHKAMDENLFCLYAQPIVPLGDVNQVHYELLIRMVDDDGSTIPPGAFLPAAERYDIITKIDRWVVTHAFKLLLAHPEFLRQIDFVSINLSGQSLAEIEFLNFVLNEFTIMNIPANKICFEITETAAISNLSTATLFISKMKELGCQFALDDFGSGLASFGYLKNLSVDYLKIDGMFVKNMANDAMDHAMVKSINDIGHVMGIETIAEFVENDKIKDLLTEMGVNFGQGYGLGKPQPFEEVLALSNTKHKFKSNSSSIPEKSFAE